MALPLQHNFAAIAVPAVIATVAVAQIRHERSAVAVLNTSGVHSAAG